MPDIFDEVEEELRAERTKQFLTRYAGVILSLALLAVIGVAGWQGWRWYQARQDQAAAAVYMQAMVRAEPQTANSAARAAALAEFARLGQTAPQGYRTLARLRAAGLASASGHQPQALELWNQVAADPSADPLLRDLATLLWAQHQIESGDPAILEARLKPLTAPGGAWQALAREQLALLAMRQGNTAAARHDLTALVQDSAAPNGVRQRATALLAQLAG